LLIATDWNMRIGQAQLGEVLISLHEREEPIFGVDAVSFLATSYDEAPGAAFSQNLNI
jgi:hypothetical protein